MSDIPDLVIVDGAGDRYEVIGGGTIFTLRSLDRPSSQPFEVSEVTLRDLGMEWNGKTMKEVGRS